MDLSATGMALVVDGDMDLTSGQTLQLKFSVQWDPKPLNFAGRVCYCGMRDGDMRYGIDFVEHQTPNFEEEQDRLVDYVMTRQREVLRRAAQVDTDDTSDDDVALSEHSEAGGADAAASDAVAMHGAMQE